MTGITMDLRVTYQFSARDAPDAAGRAAAIALEQTVELAADAVPADIAQRVVGRVEAVEPLADARWRAVIAFAPVLVGDDLPQLLNLVFGNISFQPGILVTAIDWPPELLRALGGPALGIAGLRALIGAPTRALLCAVLKPVGLSALELAERCHRLALGGSDVIKDDHSLVDQPPASFRERVERCQEAVARANRTTGGNTLYFPNVTAGAAVALERADFARRAGCRGLLVSALPAGLDTVRALARATGLAVMAHPSLGGAFFHADHGIAPEVLLGDLFRIAGSDAVIYPNVGGRFTFSEATCTAINDHLRRPLGALRPACPAPGGGMDAARVPHWIERYGADTMFLLGGSLYAQPDLTRAARQLADLVGRHPYG
ncbi:MAG TPA: RuBisCO large subunit C-terminal-like domain-containing protein [Gemmatimonadales bacterium]|nr:RuBisCO large subunit C-terminal-like domain-containing protein [Gemmatimonadales bacterium]